MNKIEKKDMNFFYSILFDLIRAGYINETLEDKIDKIKEKYNLKEIEYMSKKELRCLNENNK